MKDSFIILGCFLLGLAASALGIIPPIDALPEYSKWVLYLLMFLVGINLGLDSSLVPTLKSQPIRVLLLPLATVIGTLAGTIIAFLLLEKLSLSNALCIGSGYGYYSLSSIFLNEARGAEIGTIALAANIIRELLTVTLAPIMVRLFGPFAPICSGGATTMDVTLPISQKASANHYIPVSVCH